MRIRGLTDKQIEILSLVKNLNTDGTNLSITQLHQALSYSCSEQAILCSVNFLQKRGLVEKTGQNVVRDGRRFTVVKITTLGEESLTPYVASIKNVLIEKDEDDEIEEIF